MGAWSLLALAKSIYYLTILTEPEVNNCFSIYTRSDLNRIRKETMKKISLIHGWIHAWTWSRKQQMHNSLIFTVFSKMANHSLICFVSFSINGWKENVESLNNSPFWEETESYICFCQLTVNESFFVASYKCCQQRLRSRWAMFICSAVFFAMLTCWHVQFSKMFAFFFFLHKLTSISRQTWSCEEIPSSQNSDKEASFSSVVVNKNIASGVWKSTTVNHFAIKSRCLNTMKYFEFLPSKSSTLGYSCILKIKVLTLKLGNTPSSRQQLCFALYSPPSAVNMTP